MALAVMLSLTVLVTSAVAYTSSDSRDASRSNATQKAYAAAEAGLNDALAYVQTIGGDSTKMYVQPSSTSCGSASPATCGVTTLTGGASAYWGGSFNGASQVWTLKSIGAVPDPTGGPLNSVTRTLTQTATITPRRTASSPSTRPVTTTPCSSRPAGS